MLIRIILFIFIIFLGLSCSAGNVFAQAELEYDLGIRNQDVVFSASRLVAGQRITIYAAVRNFGKKDITGYVSFYQGDAMIGDTQGVSVKAGGLPDDVFVNFIVPPGAFNIRVEIKGQAPRDDNAANDVAVTALITPEGDVDGDVIMDAEDNCPTVANVDQKDTDGDKAGDACDEDADNDGVANSQEEQQGSDILKPDTDADGVSDKIDAFPLDPLKYLPEKTEVKKTLPAPKSSITTPAPAKPNANSFPVASPLTKDAPISKPSSTLKPRINIFSEADTTLSPLDANQNRAVITETKPIVPPALTAQEEITQQAPEPGFFSFQRWSTNAMVLALLVIFAFSLLLGVGLRR